MKVFVYGTLKRGFGANYKLDHSVSLGEAVSVPTFVIKGAGFPLAFLSSSGHPVRGELYEIDEDTRRTLDSYEGYPNFYTRDEFSFVDEAGEEHTAWMYHIPSEPDEYPARNELKPGEDGVLEWRRE